MVNDDTLRWPECTVREFMAPNAVTVLAEASLSLVAETLADYGVSGLPVVDRRGAVGGVISQTDIVRLRAGSMPPSGWPGLLVRDAMTMLCRLGRRREHGVHMLAPSDQAAFTRRSCRSSTASM